MNFALFQHLSCWYSAKLNTCQSHYKAMTGMLKNLKGSFFEYAFGGGGGGGGADHDDNDDDDNHDDCFILTIFYPDEA